MNDPNVVNAPNLKSAASNLGPSDAVADAADPIVPVIRAEQISIRLGQFNVIESLDFDARPGEFVAVLGPNGAGKTTLFKAILGVIALTDGSLSVLGGAPGAGDPRAIGYVPQVKSLDRGFPALAMELVVSGIRGSWPGRIGRAEAEAARAALERVGAGRLARRSIGELSGGELQRVYLARSFVRRPALVLLDEPATGIDVAGQADVFELLDEYQRETGATVLMITHDLGTARHHADRVLVINHHRIVFGPPAVALAEGPMREAFGHLGHAHAMVMAGAAGNATGEATDNAGGCSGRDDAEDNADGNAGERNRADGKTGGREGDRDDAEDNADGNAGERNRADGKTGGLEGDRDDAEDNADGNVGERNRADGKTGGREGDLDRAGGSDDS